MRTLPDLINDVAKCHDVDPRDLTGRRRFKEITQARHITMWIMRKRMKMSYGRIGIVFGRSHATIIHAVKSIDNRLSYDKKFKEFFEGTLDICITKMHIKYFS